MKQILVFIAMIVLGVALMGLVSTMGGDVGTLADAAGDAIPSTLPEIDF